MTTSVSARQCETNQSAAPLIVDSCGRPFTYLRISITDLCNLRCVYCMPAEGVDWLPRSNILSYEEITTVARIAAECGVNKIRLTGGEPLVRRGVEKLIRSISSIAGIKDLGLTTNGIFLARRARSLAEAGLKRVNVSMDTLDSEKFRQITRRGKLKEVMDGIDAAEAAGLSPVKINVVVMGGLNDDEVEAFAALTVDRPVQVRFIELMPLGEGKDCVAMPNQFQFVSNQISRQRIQDKFGELEPAYKTSKSISSGCCCPSRKSGEAADVWRIAGAKGSIGFISPMSAPFCSSCNRLRLSADGTLRSCLLNGGESNVRELLRTETTESEDGMKNLRTGLIAAFREVAMLKPKVHASWNEVFADKMSQIGG